MRRKFSLPIAFRFLSKNRRASTGSQPNTSGQALVDDRLSTVEDARVQLDKKIQVLDQLLLPSSNDPSQLVEGIGPALWDITNMRLHLSRDDSCTFAGEVISRLCRHFHQLYSDDAKSERQTSWVEDVSQKGRSWQANDADPTWNYIQAMMNALPDSHRIKPEEYVCKVDRTCGECFRVLRGTFTTLTLLLVYASTGQIPLEQDIIDLIATDLADMLQAFHAVLDAFPSTADDWYCISQHSLQNPHNQQAHLDLNKALVNYVCYRAKLSPQTAEKVQKALASFRDAMGRTSTIYSRFYLISSELREKIQ